MNTTFKDAFQNQTYIVNPWYDNLFFLMMPLFAFLIALTTPYWAYTNIHFGDDQVPAFAVAFLLIEIAGGSGLIRAYLNPKIFKRFWFVFTVVPILLFCALYISLWVVVIAITIDLLWDIVHTTMQTFGISKFYDQKHGNNTEIGRRQDIMLNYVIYAGPIFLHLGFISESQAFDYLELFDFTHTTGIAAIPLWLEEHSLNIAAITIIVSAVVIVNYFFTFRKLVKNNEYKLCSSKIILLSTTAFCTYTIWQFNDFLMAFLATNIFHAAQYFALVWYSEKDNISKILHVEKLKYHGLIVFAFFFAFATAMAVAFLAAEYQFYDADDLSAMEGLSGVIIRLWIVIGLLHYWHDRFIWSSKKINRE